MYIFTYDFFEKEDVFKVRNLCLSKPLNTYLPFFRNKSDAYLSMYIRNLENSRSKPVFRYTISIFIVWVG